MKVFVINLERRADRREHVAKVMSGIQFEYWTGWDGAERGEEATDAELAKYYSKKWNAGLYKNKDKIIAQKGCCISHTSLLKHCVDNDINECIILEDDIDFDGELPKSFSSKFPINYIGGQLGYKGIIKNMNSPKFNWIIENKQLYEINHTSSPKPPTISCYTTHAYHCNPDILYKAISRRCPIPIDNAYIKYIQRYWGFGFQSIVKQSESIKSDITNKNTMPLSVCGGMKRLRYKMLKIKATDDLQQSLLDSIHQNNCRLTDEII